MDRISVEQRDTIKRTSSDRLRARLEQAGWSSDDVAALDRDQLMDAIAELYAVPAEGAEKPEEQAEQAAEASLVAKELELRQREIALRELEIRERREERLAQEKRWQEEIIAQEKRWEEEMALNCAEYERLQKIDAEKAKQEKTLAARTKKFAESV